VCVLRVCPQFVCGHQIKYTHHTHANLKNKRTHTCCVYLCICMSIVYVHTSQTRPLPKTLLLHCLMWGGVRRMMRDRTLPLRRNKERNTYTHMHAYHIKERLCACTWGNTSTHMIGFGVCMCVCTLVCACACVDQYLQNIMCVAKVCRYVSAQGTVRG
jgi:hypothetical protein